MILDSTAAATKASSAATLPVHDTVAPEVPRLQLVIDGQHVPVCPDDAVVLGANRFWSGYRLEWIRVADTGTRVRVATPRHRIVYVQHGTSEVTYRAGGHVARCRLSPGVFCFISCGFMFERLDWKSRGLEVILVDVVDFGVDTNPIDAFGRTDALFDMSMGIEDGRVATLVELMCSEVAAGCPTGQSYGEALSLALASRVASLCAAMPGSRRRLPMLSAHQLQRVSQHVARHLGEDLAIERLAAAVNMSAFHFARCFKRATGMTPHKYVTQQRILRAREMIVDGRRSISDVAFALGFASQSHFADVYRRATGTSPGRDRSGA
jgi:AraC family transcriptional regulator